MVKKHVSWSNKPPQVNETWGTEVDRRDWFMVDKIRNQMERKRNVALKKINLDKRTMPRTKIQRNKQCEFCQEIFNSLLSQRVCESCLGKITKQEADEAYDAGNTLMTDEEYDRRFGVNTDTFSGLKANKTDVKLPMFLGSLDKAVDQKGIDKRLIDGKYVALEKLDGVSALFDNGKLYTRGNGKKGKDISFVIDFLPDSFPDEGVFRGELVFRKSSGKIRNDVAGVIGRKNHKPEDFDDLEFVVYNAFEDDYESFFGPMKDQMRRIKDFELLSAQMKPVKDFRLKTLTDLFHEMRQKSDFEIDGIVLVPLNTEVALPKNRNPRDGVFAFKVNKTGQETIVTGVEWNVSARGLWKPIVWFKPIQVAGATLTKATANNATWIKERKIGPGAVVSVIRSGEIIPKIIEVLRPSDEPVVLPKGTFVGKDLKAATDNPEVKKQTDFKKIQKWVKVLDVKGLGPASIKKLDLSFEEFLDRFDDLDLFLEKLGKSIGKKVNKSIEEKVDAASAVQKIVAWEIFEGFSEKRVQSLLDADPELTGKIKPSGFGPKLMEIIKNADLKLAKEIVDE